jgi:ArsR family transcriptional regulator, arsenate/arsenite/antimonite-responsive transcriptional repressor
MGKKDKRELADMFKALGDPTRLKIYRFLRGRCWPHAADEIEEIWLENGPTVSEVCTKVTGSKKVTSKVSQHLKELRLAGLITIERRGKNMICGINQGAVTSLVTLLNCVDEMENAIPELTVSVEPAVAVEPEPVVEVVNSAEPQVEEQPAAKSRKKSVQAKTVDLPVVEVELVKTRRKSKANGSQQDPSAPAA